ncbi:MAG: hypothetical protein M0Z61_03235 [Nitrospiraceae bacterium]|nr:hypothetical protein [Nitrospiraceae bacterium]
MGDIFELDYNNLLDGKPSIQISNEGRRILECLSFNPEEVKKYAQEHQVYSLCFEDEVIVDGKHAFGSCISDPPSNNLIGEIKTYKITLRKNIDSNMRQTEINQIKNKFGIEILEKEFYYWLFFHELGHTIKGSGEQYHAGFIDKTKSSEFKKKQEELAEKYCLHLYREWKTKKAGGI